MVFVALATTMLLHLLLSRFLTLRSRQQFHGSPSQKRALFVIHVTHYVFGAAYLLIGCGILVERWQTRQLTEAHDRQMTSPTNILSLLSRASRAEQRGNKTRAESNRAQAYELCSKAHISPCTVERLNELETHNR